MYQGLLASYCNLFACYLNSHLSFLTFQKGNNFLYAFELIKAKHTLISYTLFVFLTKHLGGLWTKMNTFITSNQITRDAANNIQQPQLSYYFNDQRFSCSCDFTKYVHNF